MTSLVLLSVYIATRIRMHRVFALCICPVCSRCGRLIAYCEMGENEKMAKQSLVEIYEEVSTWQWAKDASSDAPMVDSPYL